jgi:TatD DNase family protein
MVGSTTKSVPRLLERRKRIRSPDRFSRMFDTHCHLQTDAFDEDRTAILKASRESGVDHFLVPAIDKASFAGTLQIANSEPEIYCALGIHPHNALEWSAEIADAISLAAETIKKVVAVGEIGLDYYYDFAPQEAQIRAFEEQVALAQKLRLPVIVHTRESDDDVWAVLSNAYGLVDSSMPRGQLHCFSGTTESMKRAVNSGFYISFTGNITFKKSTLDDVVREAPIERILLETDSPYLSPVPFRGKRNSPANLRLVAEKVAEIKRLDIQEVMHQTTQNALRLFTRVVSVIVMLLAISTAAHAQRTEPIGTTPPDSVLTTERRKAEELRKKQEEELQREAEQRRQDSIASVQQEMQELQSKMAQQAREDSLAAAERIADEERQRIHMQTPVPWKAIGIGGGLGIANVSMILQKPSLTPTSVLASTFDLTTQVLRRLDVQIGFTHLHIGDDFPHDSVWNLGPNTPNATELRKAGYDPRQRLVEGEDFNASVLSIDVRYVITRPSAAVSFYLGAGYDHISMSNDQRYFVRQDSVSFGSSLNTFSANFSRSGLSLLFGMRRDFEIGNGLTVTPYAQISAFGAFQGTPGDASSNQNAAFIFRADPDQIIMTHVKLGVTLAYGWWGVPRVE